MSHELTSIVSAVNLMKAVGEHITDGNDAALNPRAEDFGPFSYIPSANDDEAPKRLRRSNPNNVIPFRIDR